jgi:DNA excision repair protein ERCC-1
MVPTGGTTSSGTSVPNPHAMPSTTIAIVNPYLKRKRTTTDSSSSNNDAAQQQPARTSCTTISKGLVLQPVDVGGSTKSKSSSLISPVSSGYGGTFSQAFSSLETTEQYAVEVENVLRKSGAVEAVAVVLNDTKTTTTTGESGVDQETTAQPNIMDPVLQQPHVLHVSLRQRGNPILKYIRNVPYAFVDYIVPDYILGVNRCALFLSLRYHNLHPDYIYRRIRELQSDYTLRVLLVLVDVEENYRPALLFLNKLATQHRLSLLLSWSEEEAARYLETFKAFESKDASLIQKKDKDTFADQLTDVICTVRSVNKTDVSQLLSQLGSFRSIAMADMDELSLIPGMCPANSSSYCSKTFLLHVYRFYFFLFLFY